MAKLRVAIIGCGAIANSAHIPNYMKNEDVEIKYFCDIIPEKADKAVEKYGCGQAIYDYHEILNNDDIDAVSVCTHNDFHSIISIDFMKAGKDVLCEKPAARTLKEAKKMQEVMHKTDRILSIGVVNRFNDAVNRIKKMIENGELGEVYHVYTSFRAHRSIPGLGGDFTTYSSSGGGALIDWGVHFLDLVLYCVGDPKPVSASGEAFSKLGKDMKNYVYENMWAKDTSNIENGTYDVEDSVTGIVRTENGPTITLHGAWAQNIGIEEMYIDFMGVKGGVRLWYGGNYTFYTTRDGALIEEKPKFPTRDHYSNEIDSFVNSCLTHTPNQATIDNAILTSKIMDGIYRSSNIHKEVKIYENEYGEE